MHRSATRKKLKSGHTPKNVMTPTFGNAKKLTPRNKLYHASARLATPKLQKTNDGFATPSSK